MKTQNYSNHTRLLIGWHGITFIAILLFLVGSIIFLIKSNCSLESGLLLIAAIIFSLLFVYVRVFALKAQDRAIRAEENLRYFTLTGKLLDKKLTIEQIIALRFASDEELVALAQKAMDENLTNKAIKQLIVQWKADEYRV